MEKKWHIYILECNDGSLYTGVTNNLEKRMKVHSKGKGSKYVNAKGFKKILKSKLCESRSEAQKTEAHIKSLGKNKKLKYLSSL